jgi:diguanylate cyclase (GGDEF)-like protein
MSVPDHGAQAQAVEVAREAGFAQCVHALRRTLATTPVGWLLVVWMCWNRVPHGRIALWVAGFAVSWLLGLWILRRVVREGPRLARDGTRLFAVAGLDGIAWGTVVWLLMGHDPLLDPWLAAVLSGVGAVNAPAYITFIRAYHVQVGAMWALAMAGLLLHMARANVLEVMFGLTVFYALISVYMRPVAERVLEGIRLQLANATLAEQLRSALQLVEQDAATDALTGQANRRALDGVLKHQVELADRLGQPFSVLLLDIDHFKQINDRHGHGVGDETLRAFAARVGEHLRQGDVCARYGGEEFVVVLPGTRLAAARDVAERLRQGIAGGALLQAPLLSATVSIGAAEHVPGQTVQELLNAADGAVYAAKRGGRNQVQVSELVAA